MKCQELSHKEIANKLKISEGGVKVAFNKINLKLGLDLSPTMSHKEKLWKFKLTYGIYLDRLASERKQTAAGA